MRSFFTVRRIVLLSAILLMVLAGVFAYQKSKNKAPDWVTETVSRGEVANIVSVSGVVEANSAAELAFPVTGIVENVYVSKGDLVLKDQLLVSLVMDDLRAERTDAEGAVRIAVADRDELLRGPRSEAREVTAIDIQIAEANLARTIAEESQKIENARRSLYSDGLEALPQNPDNDDVAPSVSGTYTCNDPGEYIISVFSSGSQSGYSYRLSGLESGTYTAYTESPAPLGSCGLNIQFDADESYGSKDWFVSIPNTRSVLYPGNLNAYALAQKQQLNAVDAASQALEKARREAVLLNAEPESEALSRAEARVTQAVARLSAIDARIADRMLTAPFEGTINTVDVIAGEAVGATPVLTMVADDRFELIVRIPEIDITRVKVGQTAEVVFDALQSEVVPGTISFIAPLATIIDGVAYFEATVSFENPPLWLRGGLNADVDIVIEKHTEVLRIPKRFLVDESGEYRVLIPQGTKTATTAVEVVFVGNDGFAEITGLSEGDTVIAP